ncbi:hypothetical protein AUJ46_04745 [Candidatus Peregrinibacteria bacterium CG1_02_54_53]|nr:MAG: hypothetical protein AUJ46_04745 [Candidatus Peregrinibacteria bacterium CG1_02_54_53]
MNLLLLLVGIALPSLSGWLLVRLCEGNHPVLLRLERWAIGFLLGITATMFVTFLAHIAGLILFTRWGFLSVQIAMTTLLTLARFFQWKLSPRTTAPSAAKSPTANRWLILLLVLLTLWTLAKIAFGSFILVSMPSYFDDTLKNWNYRAKIFAFTQTLDIDTSANGEADVLSSYPPTVPLFKASLAALKGGWDEGLVNSVHILWLLAALALLYGALRHRIGWQWSLLGTYLLASLPLYFFDGLNAYADVFLSGHLLAAGALLTHGLTEHDASRRQSWLRLFGLTVGLLVFTKNEALVLYLPLLLAVFGGGLIFLRHQGRMTLGAARTVTVWTIGWLLVIGVPWVAFKWAHGLSFGNAKAITSSYSFGWQPGVPYVLWVNTFFEGNWHLLFPLLLLLLVVARKHLLRSAITPLVLIVLAALGLQIALFLFTSLSTEALKQTGLARGFVQLAPLVVMLVTFLARDVVKGR